MSVAATVEQLKKVPLFKHCTNRQLRDIARRGFEHEYAAGDILCREGQRGAEFFVILSGEADVRRGRRRAPSLKAGDHFGEIAVLQSLLSPRERTATITATSPLRCFILGASDFKAVVYEPGVAVRLLYSVIERMTEDTKTAPSG